MKIISKISLLAIILSVGCSSGIKVTSDMNKDTDFSTYKTFSFLGWQEDSDQLMSDFDRKRIHDAFREEFKLRDLKWVEEGGDMSIALYLVIDQKTTVTGYTDYYGGGYGRYNRYGGGWGGGSSTTTYTESDYLVGTLVMDAFDEKSTEQIWQGIAVGTINESAEKREKSIPKNVNALMREFPIGIVDQN